MEVHSKQETQCKEQYQKQLLRISIIYDCIFTDRYYTYRHNYYHYYCTGIVGIVQVWGVFWVRVVVQPESSRKDLQNLCFTHRGRSSWASCMGWEVLSTTGGLLSHRPLVSHHSHCIQLKPKVKGICGDQVVAANTNNGFNIATNPNLQFVSNQRSFMESSQFLVLQTGTLLFWLLSLNSS